MAGKLLGEKKKKNGVFIFSFSIVSTSSTPREEADDDPIGAAERRRERLQDLPGPQWRPSPHPNSHVSKNPYLLSQNPNPRI